MWGRRIVYLLGLLGSVVFYGFYREWFSWLALVAVFLLPWFSLLVSLPAILTVQAGLRCPESVRMGVPARTALKVDCRFPTPPVSCRIKLHNSLTDARFVGKPGERIPTEHCGCMTISYDRLFVYDYLGLFCRRLRKGDTTHVYIEPKPVACDLPEQLQSRTISLWRPKPGGGFSENHDLRYYRPGDDLRNIHWKMSAKTGKLVYREPIEPAQKGYLLTMTLCGDADTLDQKMGQLFWLNHTLLQRHCDHEVQCRTATGLYHYHVDDHATAHEGLRTLLRSAPAKGEAEDKKQNVLWQYHIGGDRHEA